METNLLTAFLVAILLAGVIRLTAVGWRRSATRHSPYPPGPPGKFILGNLRDLPPSFAWITFTEWAKIYGDICHFRVLGKSTVVLNSYEDCEELMVKRSAIYSSRPAMPMMDMMDWTKMLFAFFPYNARFKMHRRYLQQVMKGESLLSYRPMQLRKIYNLLNGLATTPDNFLEHCRTLPGAVIMSIVYGHDVSPKNDYYIELAENAIGVLSDGYPASAFLLDVIPILRYIPAWFPGAAFKRLALKGRAMAHEMRDVPFENVCKRIAEGNATPCMAVTLLEGCQSEEERLEVANVCTVAYAGGADTSAALLSSFFLIMALFPNVQNKARQEIDNVIGHGRLVAFDDLPSIPYITALVREILRWRPIAPLSVAHSTTEDDVYKGYYIPKGCTIVSNVWAISRNPERYSQPEDFNPNRFFNKDGTLNDDDVSYAFGFGRRYCPGVQLAMSTSSLTIALVIQNFIIGKKKDLRGEEIPIKPSYKDGLISHPLSFECSVETRSAETRKLVLEVVGNY